ncbi:MAG: maltotransferase domain-containing protein, partial [Kofleriaceae bacterium]
MSGSSPRAVVLAVRPEVDGGRYPAKRVLGETLAIEADIVTDGHDVLRAMALVQAPGAAWRELELVHAGNDAWRAEVALAQLGRHRFTAIAWVDAFATWKRGLERKLAAGVDVRVEL